MELMMREGFFVNLPLFARLEVHFFFCLLKNPLWPSGEWEKKRQRDRRKLKGSQRLGDAGGCQVSQIGGRLWRGAGHCIGCRGGIAAEHEGCLSYFSVFAWAPTPPQLPRESALMCHQSRRQMGEEINKWMEMKAPRVLSQIMGRREKGRSAGEMKAGTERGNNVGKKVQLMAVMHLRHSRACLHPHN